MPVRARAVCLQAGHTPYREVALARQRADRAGEGARGDPGDLAERLSAVETIRAEPLRDGEDDLPVRDGREERGVQPLCPQREPFRVAAGTEVPALAGEREQVFVGTGVKSGCARSRARGYRRRGTCPRLGRRRGATGRTRARSARRTPSAVGGDDPAPTGTTATPVGVGACRRRGPPAPRVPCAPSALPDDGAPSIRATGTGAVIMVLRRRLF